jgi:predicted site-specific integrase-resolvase
MFVPLRKASSELGLSANTLRKYADDGIIESYRTPSGQRRFNIDSFRRSHFTYTILYSRVSSNKQKDDLIRQKDYLRTFDSKGEEISDVASGLNYKRKGLRTILERIVSGDSIRLVVAERDRLCRFGFELIEYLITLNGGEIVVLNQSESSPESELVSDIL